MSIMLDFNFQKPPTELQILHSTNLQALQLHSFLQKEQYSFLFCH